MINCINFIFNILYFFLALSIPFVLVIDCLIIWEKLQERNEVQLDDTATIFRCRVKKQKPGVIYCLDKNFLEVAKQEIGEENLIKYFKEDFN